MSPKCIIDYFRNLMNRKIKFLGIEFAPLNVPFERRLQTLSAAIWVIIFVFGSLISLFFTIYLILCTSLRLPILIYVLWMCFVDNDTCEKGGRNRRSEWARKWILWKYFINYFPAKLECLPNVKLDPRRNYIFGCFPHGVLPMGLFCAFGNNYSDFSDMFPFHKLYCHTIKMNFYVPIFRDFVLAMGGLSCSSSSIRWLMRRPEGGMVSVLVVGGAAEAYNSKPGEYKIVLKKRKGFVKIALQTGAPLVPVFSFGETDVYGQVVSREGSLLRKIQEAVKQLIGGIPIIPLGRGFFQYSFGIIPMRKPVTVVIGHPIDVTRKENPTKEDVDVLHEIFVNRLTQLFETQKHKYLVNCDKIKLIIE